MPVFEVRYTQIITRTLVMDADSAETCKDLILSGVHPGSEALGSRITTIKFDSIIPQGSPKSESLDVSSEETEKNNLKKLTNAQLKEIALNEGVVLDSRETKADYVSKILRNRHGQ